MTRVLAAFARHHHHHHAAATPSLDGKLAAFNHELLMLLASTAGVAAAMLLCLFIACRWTRLRWTWVPVLAPPFVVVATLAAPKPSLAVWSAACGALIATAVLIDGERKDERHGGRRRRRVRAKRGPVAMWSAWLARRRVAGGPRGAVDLPQRPAAGTRRRRTLGPAKRGATASDGRIAIGEERRTRRPVALSLAQLRKHTLILGATGSGKSNALLWLTTSLIRAGYGAIVLDMKADPELRERLAVEAGLCGRPFYLFRLDACDQFYNPLRRGSATARRDRLAAAQTFSDDYYRGLFVTHAKLVIDVLDAIGEETTIPALAEWWDPRDLRELVRRISDQALRERVVRQLDRLPQRQADDIATLRARIAEVAEIEAAERLRAGSSEADEIDLEAALQRRAVVVFSINADSYPGAGATVGKLILQDLVALAGDLRQTRTPARAVLALDEFGALDGEQIGRLLSTSRDVELMNVLAGQDLAQLRRVSEHFAAEVKANVCAVIAHRQSEPDSAEEIARIAGTEEVVKQTLQIDRRRFGLPHGAESGDQTGVGSQHYERHFLVNPDEIKNLDTGEALVRASAPPSVDTITFYRCESAGEVAGLASVRDPAGVSRPATVAELVRAAQRNRERLAA